MGSMFNLLIGCAIFFACFNNKLIRIKFMFSIVFVFVEVESSDTAQNQVRIRQNNNFFSVTNFFRSSPPPNLTNAMERQKFQVFFITK